MPHNPLDAYPGPGNVSIKERGRRNLVRRATVNPPTASDLIAIPHNLTTEHELCAIVVNRQLREIGKADRPSPANL
jgi:hypothetical protein